METVDERYKEGFNIGYWLARGDRQCQKNILTHLIEQQHPETSYAQGLVAGRKQMEKEKILERINALDKAKDLDIEHEI